MTCGGFSLHSRAGEERRSRSPIGQKALERAGTLERIRRSVGDVVHIFRPISFAASF